MKQTPLLIAVGLLFLILFLVIKLPASVAYYFAKDHLTGLQMTNLAGTVWDGRASRAVYHGQAFSNVQWQLSASALLIGKTALTISSNDPRYPLDGDVSRSGEGDLSIHKLTGTMPASLINTIPALAWMKISGDVILNIDSIEMVDHQLKRANGKILIEQGQLIQPVKTLLGTIAVDMTTEGEQIKILLKDQQAPIGIDGQLLLTPPRQMQFNGKFIPTTRADNFLVSLLKNTGQLQSDGKIVINYQGKY
jgi:general secretion pathway protein N